MAFIKRYWFGIIIGLFIAVFVIMLVLILLAPKQDVKARGFVACTQNLIDNLTECDKKLWCSGKAIASNTWCDLNVIATGLVDWTKGKQPRPWSNYIFEPELPLNSFVDEEARQEYLKEHPNVQQEMEQLHKFRKELENEQNSQQNDEIEWNQE